MIDVKGFCKAYDDQIAVQDLSFQVNRGEIVGLVGRNGAGKTTTLRAISGMIPLSRGTVQVDGKDLEVDPIDVKRLTAYVPDDPRLFEDLSVEQHVQFHTSMYDVPYDNRVEDLLHRFELNQKRNTRASSLSRGMRQKLAICCAYIQNPVALLLDEPMTGLDPPAIRALKDSILANSKQGMAIMISSHLLAMVEDICTHVLILDQGRSRFWGTLEQLRVEFGSNDDVATQQDKSDLENSSLERAFFTALNGYSGDPTISLAEKTTSIPS